MSCLSKLRSGTNLMEVKKVLACNLVEQYHGQPAVSEAETMFCQIVQLKGAPAELPEVLVPSHLEGTTSVDLCSDLGLSKSKSKLRRLMKQGGFYVEKESVRDTEAVSSVPDEGVVIRLGKRRYYRLITEK